MLIASLRTFPFAARSIGERLPEWAKVYRFAVILRNRRRIRGNSGAKIPIFVVQLVGECAHTI